MPLFLGSVRIGTAVMTESISKSILLQSKIVTPSNSQQVISADDGYDGLKSVTVEAVETGSGSGETIPSAEGVEF